MISVKAAEEVPWADIQAVFGTRGQAFHCQCSRYTVGDYHYSDMPREARAELLQAERGGLIAYLDGEPAGWCALGPRPHYPRLRKKPSPWKGRDEDPADEGVWSVTCFVTRIGYRRQGVTYALAAATVDYARANGAKAVEAYPMLTEPGKDITWGELHVGSRGAFAAAGYLEVTRPFPRRVVMRIDF